MPSIAYRRRRGSTSSSDYSDGSDYSHSTAPTDYSRRTSPEQYFPRNTSYKRWDDDRWEGSSYGESVHPHSSVETYASTVDSDEDLDEELPEFEIPSYQPRGSKKGALPSTSSDFAKYFPSAQRLWIRHDDSSLDGNMNLRVDTEIQNSGGKRVDLTLFHLRMHDLKNREFSLRRYCRESGREVCHSSRKYTKPSTGRRPALQRSMSNAISSFRSKSDSRSSTVASLKRHDSGYGSLSEEDVDAQVPQRSAKPTSSIPLPTNTTQLEFSNYAHVDVKRRGTKISKRYDFEYWGTQYMWKRLSKKTGASKEISYHLMNTSSGAAVAHIVPATMTRAEVREEEELGGWVPPCSLWINDQLFDGSTDIAE